MGYGLKTLKRDQTVIIDTSARLNRHRYSNEVAAGASSNTTLSDISGLLTAEVSIMINPPTAEEIATYAYCPHQVTRSGTTITWTAASGSLIASNDSLIQIFFYV